jgi:ribosomal protein S3AE
MALQKGVDKWKEKQWFDIYPPKDIATEIIGSVPSGDEKNMLGREIKVNLSWITNNPNHSFITVGLRVSGVSGNSASTEVDSLAQQFSYLHSFVKRRGDAIYTYDRVRGKDGKEMVLKLLITTRNKIARRTQTDIRKAVSGFIADYTPKMAKGEFIKAVISGSFQQEGMKRLAKIVPISRFEIRKLEF